MWGASAAQFGLAIALIWIAAHEGVPAGRLPRQVVYSTAVAAFFVVVVATLLTFCVWQLYLAHFGSLIWPTPLVRA
jgi:hypothetical protein